MDGREYGDFRISFADWGFLKKILGSSETIGENYEVNGYGIEGIVQTQRLDRGLEVEAPGIDYNSEGDTCFIHFSTLADAEESASLLSAAVKDKAELERLAAIAEENELGE